MSRSSSQAGGNRGTAIVEPGWRYEQLTGNQLNRGGGKWQKSMRDEANSRAIKALPVVEKTRRTRGRMPVAKAAKVE